MLALAACLVKAALKGSVWGVVCSGIYGVSMVAVYAMSAIYHGLRKGMGKKVMQVLDHCAIYFLIAGTYTPVVLCALRPQYPIIGWGLFALQWSLASLAVTLTAIDLKKYKVFSMLCYIGMGWAVIPFAKQTMVALTAPGFYLLLWGGIAYTIGAVLYGIGSRKKWMQELLVLIFTASLLAHGHFLRCKK